MSAIAQRKSRRKHLGKGPDAMAKVYFAADVIICEYIGK